MTFISHSFKKQEVHHIHFSPSPLENLTRMDISCEAQSSCYINYLLYLEEGGTTSMVPKEDEKKANLEFVQTIV